MTPAQRTVLIRALKRPEHLVCPTPGLWDAAQTAVLDSLRNQGLITQDSCPVLTKRGIALATSLHARYGGGR